MKNILICILFYSIAVFFFIWAIYVAFTTNNALAILVCCVISAIASRTPEALRQQRHGAQGE
jgi:hypothetical protein